jgi:DNA invertase Pin-like site-specific DNA recombinase
VPQDFRLAKPLYLFAADRLGHTITEVYCDQGISGGKGRDKRPAFDKLHRDAARRKFDVVMAWSVDRLGRSLLRELSPRADARDARRCIVHQRASRGVR